MKDNKIAMHTEAVNLARRWSVQNENDLMQVRRKVWKYLLAKNSGQLPLTFSGLCEFPTIGGI